MTPFVMLLALVAAHALCDYPLQGDFLSKAKNRMAPIPGVPWWQAMWAHAAIHGGAVGLITGVWWLGLLETAAHFVIDDEKCRGRLSYNADQLAHLVLKACWVAIAWRVTL
jgi:hypothetical protein